MYTINGLALQVDANMTVLEAQSAALIFYLCHDPSLLKPAPPHGVVEVAGDATPAACTTPVAEGMVVETETARTKA